MLTPFARNHSKMSQHKYYRLKKGGYIYLTTNPREYHWTILLVNTRSRILCRGVQSYKTAPQLLSCWKLDTLSYTTTLLLKFWNTKKIWVPTHLGVREKWRKNYSYKKQNQGHKIWAFSPPVVLAAKHMLMND